MIFNSSWFLAFFLLFLGSYLILPNSQSRLLWLLAGSFVFHAHFAGPAGMLPILATAAVVYVGARIISSLPQGSRQRYFGAIALIAVPVLVLIYYKYLALIAQSVLSLAASSSVASIERPLFLPLALSFFTFEFVHYIVEVYKGGAPIKNLAHYALFCIFYPSLVSGPVKRYAHFVGQLAPGLSRPSAEQLARGAWQVLIGYFKKLVIADNAALLIKALDQHAALSPWNVALLCALLSVRILFDFSGYSDIAIGLAKMLGLELPQNFNYPYAASNIADFWRRWHMSLSSWIRDYVYIPLGGKNCGPARRARNLLVAMFICGMWHGAAWHFGCWGLYHGIGLIAHRVWRSRRVETVTCERGHALGILLTNIFVAYGWLLFFYPLDRVWQLTLQLFGAG